MTRQSDKNTWGSLEWNESHFPADQLDSTGDTWGIRWRGMEKSRHRSYLDLIGGELCRAEPISVLDIGCALCDFTCRARDVNPQNKISGMDVSHNAVAWTAARFPEFTIKLGAIPEIPFDGEFDVVFCLEVLCYLDRDARRQTIVEIRRRLAPGGIVMVSGVLDGGVRHHTAEEITGLLDGEFRVLATRFNHWSAYRRFVESPLDAAHESLGSLLRLASLNDSEFEQWRRTGKGGIKSGFVRATRTLRFVAAPALRMLQRFVRFLTGRTFPVRVLHHVQRLVRGADGADEIVVVAVRQD